MQQSAITDKPAAVVANENIIPVAMTVNTTAPVANSPAVHVTTLVLKSNQVLEVTKYRIDGGVVSYHGLNGSVGAVDTAQIDWLRTTQMTAEVRSVDLPWWPGRRTRRNNRRNGTAGCGRRRAITDVCVFGRIKPNKLLLWFLTRRIFDTSLTAYSY